MRVAEDANSTEVRRSEQKDWPGGIPSKVGAYYGEFLIINYMNVPIYRLDHTNRPHLIQPHPTLVHGQERKLEIRKRIHTAQNGPRVFNVQGVETTPSTIDIMQIMYDDLRTHPYFLEELNMVLCFEDQLSIVKHPHSKEATRNRIADLRNQLEDQIQVNGALVFTGNDPTGQIKSLFIELHGTICGIRVTHFQDDTDNVRLSLRNRPNSAIEFTRHKTTFTELRTQDTRVWSLGGFRISSDRDWLEQVLNVERQQKPTMIEVSMVNDLLKQARKDDADKISNLLDEKKELQRRYTQLEATYKALMSGDYHDRTADLKQAELALQREKLEQARVDAKLAVTAEQVKARREIITTIGIIAKTLTITVPLGIGLYKAIQAARSA
jgi:hypothetical protein